MANAGNGACRKAKQQSEELLENEMKRKEKEERKEADFLSATVQGNHAIAKLLAVRNFLLN